jgi:hypothetical protein
MSTRNQTVRGLAATMCLAALTACAAATTPPTSPPGGDAPGDGSVEDPGPRDEQPSSQPRCDLDTPMVPC